MTAYAWLVNGNGTGLRQWTNQDYLNIDEARASPDSLTVFDSTNGNATLETTFQFQNTAGDWQAFNSMTAWWRHRVQGAQTNTRRLSVGLQSSGGIRHLLFRSNITSTSWSAQQVQLFLTQPGYLVQRWQWGTYNISEVQWNPAKTKAALMRATGELEVWDTSAADPASWTIETGWPSLTGVTCVEWASNGTKLLVVDAGQPKVINVATKAVESGWPTVTTALHVTADSGYTKIYWVGQTGGSGGTGTTGAWVVSTKTAETGWPSGFSCGVISHGRLSPNGAHLAFATSWFSTSQWHQIRSIATATKSLSNWGSTTSATSSLTTMPVWSPSGLFLAFSQMSGIGGSFKVYQESTRNQVYTGGSPNAARAHEAFWKPDSTYVQWGGVVVRASDWTQVFDQQMLSPLQNTLTGDGSHILDRANDRMTHLANNGGSDLEFHAVRVWQQLTQTQWDALEFYALVVISKSMGGDTNAVEIDYFNLEGDYEPTSAVQQLAGSGNAAAAATNLLKAKRPVTGTGNGSAATSSLLRVRVPITGSGRAASAATVVLDRKISLAGSGTAAATGTGSLGVTRGVAATGNNAAATTAQLTATFGLTASGRNSGYGTAFLLGDKQLVSDGRAANAGSGFLGLRRPTPGTGNAAADGTAVLAVTATLIGSGTAAATGQAAVNLALPVAGSGTAAAQGDGNIAVTRGVTGSGIAAGQGNGDLTVIVGVTALDGSGAAAAAATNLLTATRPITGSGTASATGTATITATRPLDGSGNTAAAGSATLTVAVPVDGSGDTAAAGTATLTVKVGLAGAGVAAADTTNLLSANRTITGSGVAAAQGDGNIVVDFAFTGRGINAGYGTAFLTGDKSLSGAGHGVARGLSDLSVNRTITGSGDNTADGDANLVVTIPVTGTGNTSSQGRAFIRFDAQHIFATADLAATGWDSGPTPAQPLWQQVDETTPDTADYIYPVGV